MLRVKAADRDVRVLGVHGCSCRFGPGCGWMRRSDDEPTRTRRRACRRARGPGHPIDSRAPIRTVTVGLGVPPNRPPSASIRGFAGCTAGWDFHPTPHGGVL
jgi:hypothetical protein